jgi:hypothetical protein
LEKIMSFQIDNSNHIILDGQDTGLVLGQRREGTVVYTPECRATGTRYQEHWMPFNRYSAAHSEPRQPGKQYDPAVTAGCLQLEADVRQLLVDLADAEKMLTEEQISALARKRGWFARLDGSTWVPCGSQEPGAVLDMNRAASELRG